MPIVVFGPLPTGSATPLATPTLRSPAHYVTWARPILGWNRGTAGPHWLPTRTDARQWSLSGGYFRFFCPPRDWLHLTLPSLSAARPSEGTPSSRRLGPEVS